jgi:hypothetical protein
MITVRDIEEFSGQLARARARAKQSRSTSAVPASPLTGERMEVRGHTE